jgi:hypothetical protein
VGTAEGNRPEKGYHGLSPGLYLEIWAHLPRGH